MKTKTNALTLIPRIFANWGFLIRVNSRNSRLAPAFLLSVFCSLLCSAQPSFLPFYTLQSPSGGGGGGGATNIIGNVINYELNGSSSVLATDTSGNANNATLIGSPVQGSGIITWVAATPTFGFSTAQQWPQSACTFTCWINMTTPSANQYLPTCLANHNGSVGSGYCQVFTLSSGVHFRMFSSAGNLSNFIGRNTGTVLSAGWHFIVCTWNGGTTDASIAIYADGVQSDTTNDDAGGFPGPYAGVDVQFGIGGGLQGGGGTSVDSPFDGAMTKVKIFNRVLTTGEIANLNTLGH